MITILLYVVHNKPRKLQRQPPARSHLIRSAS